jgi:hypothetical protein
MLYNSIGRTSKFVGKRLKPEAIRIPDMISMATWRSSVITAMKTDSFNEILERDSKLQYGQS